MDTTITNDRSLLSRHRRHRNRSDIRRNPRLDLAQSIAEVKQKLQAYEMGRPELPDEDEYTYLRLQEQLQRPIDIDSKEELDRWIKQEVLFHELSEQHHSWYHEFEEGHSDLAEQLIEQRIETLRQLKLSDPQKFSDLRKDHPELFRVNGHDVRI